MQGILNIENRGYFVKKILIPLIILATFTIQIPSIAKESTTTPWEVKINKNKKEQEKTFILNSFWEEYNDELLNGYIQEALENNFDIKIAKSRVKQSEAILGTVNAQRLPQLSVNPSIYPFKTISRWTGKYGSGNHLYFPLLLNWELDIFGKLSDKVKSSKYSTKISNEDLNIVKLSVASEIAASYFNIILTDTLIKNYSELVENADETIKLKRQLYDGGIISYDSLYTVEYEKVTYQKELNSLLKQKEVLLHQFAILRGISPQGNKEIEREQAESLNFPFSVDENISSDLIFQRPDVLQAELGIKKAALDVRVAKKMFLPSINLNEMVGFESIEASRIFNWESTVYQLGAGLLLDLYTGGYKMSYLKYNKEVATEKLHQYNNVLLNAFCEAENALSSLRADYNSYSDFKDALNKSEHFHRVTNIRYTNGTGNKIDELDARRKVLINENAMYGAKISALCDTVDIYKSLGSSIK